MSFTDSSGNNSEIKAEYNLDSSFHLGHLSSLHTLICTAYTASSLHLWKLTLKTDFQIENMGLVQVFFVMAT